MMQSAEVQYGIVRYGVSSLHRGKGRGSDTKSDRDIFVMDLGMMHLCKYGLQFCDNS